MLSTKSSAILAIVLVHLVAFIQGGVYSYQDTWVYLDKVIDMPEGVVLGGMDPNGYYTYVGRVYYSNNILPSRWIPELGKATHNTETDSYTSTSIEVLVANETVSYHWARSFDGYWEKNAVFVGTSSTNERAFICRAKSDDGLLTGTLYLPQRACIIKYETLPLRKFDKYEVLIREHKVAQFMPFGVQSSYKSGYIAN